MKSKFTTNIDKALLEKLKIEAIKEDRNVNGILEELIEGYLNKGDSEMRLIELNEGAETELRSGSEKELLEYLKDNIEDLTAGFYERAEEQEKQDLENFYKDVEEAESLENIDLDRVDYSYWTLEVR